MAERTARASARDGSKGERREGASHPADHALAIIHDRCASKVKADADISRPATPERPSLA
jgi:hypothetical protein